MSVKAYAARLQLVLAFIGCSFVVANAGTLRTFSQSEVVGKATAIGSRAAVILRDGTVCAIEANDHSKCTALVTLPAAVTKIIAEDGGKFDGVFDLLGDGAPQLFVDYWPEYDPDCLQPSKNPPYWCGESPDDSMVLLMYRDSGKGYQRYLSLNAPTQGYGPGKAWFLDESPRKAIFETRCGGSAGSCFFYLDMHKRSLEPISDDYFLEGEPVFEDFDRDGNAEIFIPARGRDRTATQGAVLLRWTGTTYEVWWPAWKPTPYVIYARMAQVGSDHAKEIVAILDTGTNYRGGSDARALGIWRLTAGKWHLVAKTELPPDEAIGFPGLEGVTREPHGAKILITGGEGGSFTCHYSGRKITCPPPPRAAK
jgi:hypothetical protein